MQELMLLLMHTTMADSKIPFMEGRQSSPFCSNGAIISSTSDFQTFWHNVASQFASNELVIFDTSEPSTSKRYLTPLTLAQTTNTTTWIKPSSST